jgi:hypothetical protein
MARFIADIFVDSSLLKPARPIEPVIRIIIAESSGKGAEAGK